MTGQEQFECKRQVCYCGRSSKFMPRWHTCINVLQDYVEKYLIEYISYIYHRTAEHLNFMTYALLHNKYVSHMSYRILCLI